MRGIKFRAWHKERNKMLDVFGVNFRTPATVQVLNAQYELYEELLSCVSLVQYTGLKDVNGRDIYEGDICFLIDTEYQNEQYEVAYSDSQCKFYLKDHAGRLHGFMDDYYLKVIGNIYQNSELIGVCS